MQKEEECRHLETGYGPGKLNTEDYRQPPQQSLELLHNWHLGLYQSQKQDEHFLLLTEACAESWAESSSDGIW